MTAYWPTLQARLVTLLPTLPGWDGVVVYDGPALTETGSPRYCTVGHSASNGESGSYEQPDSTIDGLREERGSIVSELVIWSGDAVLPAHRAAAFALVDALETAIRTDQTLGVLPVASTSSLAVDVVSAQDSTGATARLVITVNYFTRS